MSAAVTVNPEAVVPSDSVFKPAMILMGGRTLAFAVTFLIPVVLARVLDPAQFGTYKQLFLVWGTVYYIAQMGMASSLYYFLPRDASRAGAYVMNSLVFLGAAGVCCLALLTFAAPLLASWLSNPSLAAYLPWMGGYAFLMMLSTPLEMVLISRGKYSWASGTYAISDIARAVAFVLPAILFGRLELLLEGAVLVAAIRVAAGVWYFRREFRGTLKIDPVLLRQQLSYALPFGTAVVIEILQASLPQYVVSHWFDPAVFAVFAVGCLQIPLVDFAASPTSDVMMVRMQEHLSAGRLRPILQIWHDTTWKLALLFFPLVALVITDAREIITFLFTARYLASVPIFIAWSTIILLTVLQVDGVLRVFAETRLLLILNLIRLAIIAGLIHFAILKFDLLGGALVTVVATLSMKAGALIRMKKLLQVSLAELLPWRDLGALLLASGAAGALVVAVKSQLRVPLFPLLAITGIVYVVTYAALVWGFDLLNQSERQTIARWLRKMRGSSSAVVDYGRA